MANKIMFASDLHGDMYSTARMLDAFDREGAEKLILLGDLLYHGPRNDLPETYNPKIVIDLLNRYKDKILCVRGNCDGEVDGMVLDFPIMADYGWLLLNGRSVYITHGHHVSEENTANLPNGSILITGHTHLYANRDTESGVRYINPGSVSLPKNGNEKTYMIYSFDDSTFRIKTLEGERVITEYTV